MLEGRLHHSTPCTRQGTLICAPRLSLLHVNIVVLVFRLLMLQPGLQLCQVALDLVDVFLHIAQQLNTLHMSRQQDIFLAQYLVCTPSRTHATGCTAGPLALGSVLSEPAVSITEDQ